MFRDFKNLKNSELEEKILRFWEENKIFEKSVKRREKKPLFSFYDGPPFANGLPHYGHILATVIKDATTRFWTMAGFRVERRVGWDTHGLPVETEIEKQLNLKGKKDIERFGIEKFNTACRDSVFRYRKEWEKTLERVGRWADYGNAYTTLDNSYMESVWWVFKKLWEQKLIYKDFRVTPYCFRCGTPLSNFEVNQGYREAEDPSIYVKFRIKNSELRIKDKEYLLVWTTTPWTLTANVAIAVNPELVYTKYKADGEYLWSYNLPPEISGKKIEAVGKTSGKKLVGLEYEPLYEISGQTIENPDYYHVLPADFVSTEEGTGLVHIAPAFGEEDYNLIKTRFLKSGAKNKKFEFPFTVDEEGKMNKGVIAEGLFVKEADKVILADLEERNLLYKKEIILHQYPFCWRCDSPLLYYPLSTWYVAVTKIKDKLVKNNKKINWVPGHIKEGRFGKWLAEARDWAFSRNRFWGAALPIWQCEKCQKNIAVGSLKELAQSTSTAGNRYFLLRHGYSESNHHKIISCWLEKKIINLTDEGRKQIEKAAQNLKNKNIQLIFSSDLLRTKQTAGIISKEIGIPVKFDERLREYNVGIFNGESKESFDEFMGKEAIALFEKTPPQGENLRDIRRRAMSFILELEKNYQNKNILIVSHAYPLFLLEKGVQGLSDEEISRRILKDYQEVGEIREIKFSNLPYAETGELDLHRPYIDKIELDCPHCGGRAKRVPEVFDCWFESGSMPYSQWHYPFENKELVKKTFPADFIAEGLDQTRGWFYTLHVLAAALTLKNIGLGKDKPASKNIVVNGLILDSFGRKLSKKLRNYTEPEIVFDKYGVDALRYFLLSSTQLGEDYQFSDKGVEEIFRKVIDKFRNVFNFYELYANSQFQEVRPPEINRQYLGGRTSQTLNILDRWILARLNEVILEMTEKMKAYELTDATRILAAFIDDLSNWYVRRSRKRFSGEDTKRAAATLGYVISETSKLLAPFAPFISEAVYKSIKYQVSSIKKNESVHLEDWPKADKRIVDRNLMESMVEVRRLASLALARRLEAGIKVRQPLSELRIKNYELRNKTELLAVLKDEINVKEIIFDSKIKEELELDTEITPELKAEGVLRDLTRLVQGLRQDAGYQPKDRIILMIEGPAELNTILEKKEDFLKKEINAHDIELKHSDKFDAESSTKMGEWQIWLGVRRI
ncbi:MAG: class I tRNA ligase family protein [Candidatus Paceibacterota bacterium]